MPDIIHYILKLFISLTLVYFFYQIVLRKLTFYTWNRWYLLLYSLISFIIPFINIAFLLEKNQWKDIEAIHYIPILEKYTLVSPGAEPITPIFSLWNVVMFILLVGIFIMLVRLSIQYLSVRKIRKSATLLHNENLRLYHVDRNIIPFSFGNAIYVNRELHSEEDLNEIIRHEFVHVKQRHSIDILWSEFLCIVNWYNPFAWLLRRAIRQNLEFIADNNVIQNGFDRKQYQFLLLKVTGVSNFSIANQFNYSSLKKRIAMMNKMKSTRLNLVRFLFILPLAAILLLAFRKNQNGISRIQIKQSFTDTLPPGTQSVSLYREDKMDKAHKDFFDKNPSIILLHWNIQKNTLEIYKKNGEIEKYDLSINTGEAEAIYGKLPSPAPGSFSGAITIQGDCINKKGYCIEIIDVKGHCTVVVKNKSKKIVEQVDLLKWNDNRNHYESLYGIIPPPPPPVPVAPSASAIASTSSNTEIVQVMPVTTTSVSISSIETNLNIAQTNPVITTSASVSPITVNSNIVQTSPISTTSTSISSISNSAIAVVPIEEGVYDESPAVLGADDLQFQIYRSTTREELNQMILKAKEKGAILTFDEIKYNEKNQLISLSGTFKNKDDQSNFVATGFQKVILTMIRKNGRSHFYIMVKDREVT